MPIVLIRVSSPLVILTLSEIASSISDAGTQAVSSRRFFSSLFKNRQTNKSQGEPPSCVIWWNPCQEAWYFAHGRLPCLYRSGWMGWLDWIRSIWTRGTKIKKFRQNLWEDPHCYMYERKGGWTDWRIDANRSQASLSQSRLGFDR